MLLYNGVVLYGAGVALQTFLDVPLWATVVSMELFTVVYTGIGGIKAVVWTDVLQSAVLIVGIVATLIKGTIFVGGLGNLYHINKEGDRLHVLNFDFDPTTRNTIWTLTIVAAMRMISFGFHPATIQRMNAVPTLKDARATLIAAGIFCFILESIAVSTGLVAYAYFSYIKCDPFESKHLSNPNQILPFLVIQLFSDTPGLVGIFLAALLSACLSTISSLLSGLSALFSEDIVRSCFISFSERQVTLSAKLSVPLFGAIATAFGLMASQMRGPLTQIATLFSGAASGPLSGIFLLSIFIPWASALGVSLAGAVGLVFSTWTLIGRILTENVKINPPPLPPASIDNCPTINGTNRVYEVNSTFLNDYLGNISAVYPVGIEHLYSVSYQTLGLLTIMLTILVGLLTNYITKSRAPNSPPKYTTRRFSEMLCCCFQRDADGDTEADMNTNTNKEEKTSFI